MSAIAPVAAWEAGRLRRRRLLPAGARVSVELDQPVEPADAIAHLPGQSPPLAIDLEAELGVGPGKAASHLAVQEGDHVDEGAVLAQRRRLLGVQQTITAPRAGEVILASGDTGALILGEDDSSVALPALMSGTVAAVEDEPLPAIIVEGGGLAIAGACGYGVPAWGPLVLWDSPVPPRSGVETESWQGGLVLLSSMATEALIAAAVDRGAAGLVAPGSTPPLRGADWRSRAGPIPPLPMLLLYVPVPLTLPEEMMRFLQPLAGTVVGITGAEDGSAPELLLTGPEAEALALELGPPDLGPGRQVVVLRGSLAGRIGRVTATSGAHLFESEWRGPAAQIRIADGDKPWVPTTGLIALPTPIA